MKNKELLEIIHASCEELGIVVYLVGGFVRDHLLGIESKDIDLIVDQKLELLSSFLPNKINADFSYYPNYRTLTAKFKESELAEAEGFDFCEFRKEIYPHPGALPEVSPGDLSSDLARRDFTINSMAILLADFIRLSKVPDLDPVNCQKLIVDSGNGYTDLQQRLIRILHPQSFIDDPTRLLRAIKYQVQIKGKFESKTGELFQKAISTGALKTIQPHRICVELKKIATSKFAGLIFSEIYQQKVFHSLLSSTKTISDHVAAQLAALPRGQTPNQFLGSALKVLSEDYELEVLIRATGLPKNICKHLVD